MKEALVVVDVEDTVTPAPTGGLDYQPAKPRLFTALGVCYAVPMGSRCQNRAVAPGLMGGLLMQIARGVRGGGKKVLKYGNVYVWTCERMPEEKMERARGKFQKEAGHFPIL